MLLKAIKRRIYETWGIITVLRDIVLFVYQVKEFRLHLKTTCKQFLNMFISSTDELRNQLPANVCNQILGTQQRSHLKQLQNFISNF